MLSEVAVFTRFFSRPHKRLFMDLLHTDGRISRALHAFMDTCAASADGGDGASYGSHHIYRYSAASDDDDDKFLPASCA